MLSAAEVWPDVIDAWFTLTVCANFSAVDFKDCFAEIEAATFTD
jgi:hypothetical protein